MWWKLSREIVAANLEAQHVIALRLLKLAKGGPEVEKIRAECATESSIRSNPNA
jgi:hypothetical protein